MKKILRTALAGLFLITLAAASHAQEGSIANKKYLGIIIDWDKTMTDVANAYGNDVASKFKLFGIFIHLGNENAFPSERIPQGMTALVFFEPANYDFPADDARQKQFAYDAFISGKWDNYFHNLARQMKTHGAPIIFNLFPEMNGNWTPVSISYFGNTAEKHKLAYRKIRMIFRDEHADNVRFGWCVNQLSVPENLEANQFENLYPGDEFVDVLGVNGFGWGKLSYEETFGKALSALTKIKVAAAAKGISQELHLMSIAALDNKSKGEWMRDAFKAIETNPNIDAVTLFSITKKEDFAKRIVKWGCDSDKETRIICQSALLRIAK